MGNYISTFPLSGHKMVPIILGTPINLNIYFLTKKRFTIYEHSA
jgi:hypothetical protein